MIRYAYPRLSDADTLARLQEVRQIAGTEPERLLELVSDRHPHAQPVATGALVASPVQIGCVRRRVVDHLGEWLQVRPVPRSAVARFDTALGEVLHSSLEILPADAAHQETWNFLSAVVFPDLVWARFPDLHESRFMGGARNALRRVWLRREVLGDIQTGATNPLGEDELVGLFERTSLARNRPLIRVLARKVLAMQEENRSQAARNLYKRVTDLTGPLLLDCLAEDQLEELVHQCSVGAPWPPPGAAQPAASAQEAVPDGDDVEPPVEQTIPDRGDLVRQFHMELLNLYKEVTRELGYPASRLFHLLEGLGGVETARRIVGADYPSETFTKLWERGRLDLTVEYLVRHPHFRGLFSDELVERAVRRLGDYGLTTE
jgi:hypothetical protein